VFTPKRIDSPELLDESTAPRLERERSLRDLRRFNQYAGGAGVYRRLLRRMAPDRGERLSIVDVAAGTADALESLGDESNLVRVGIDFKIEHLLYLREGSRVRRVVGEALRLPFRSGSVDVVTSAHFFHHLTDEGNVAMLHEALRIARRGVIVNDTRRHYVPLLFVRLLGLLRLVGPITRNDAPASILRGYTVGEARAVVEKVPASRREVVRVWPFRFGLLLWR
jgi:ubiquinone/menaquinone biosynthesis C-methylase UbiE